MAYMLVGTMVDSVMDMPRPLEGPVKDNLALTEAPAQLAAILAARSLQPPAASALVSALAGCETYRPSVACLSRLRQTSSATPGPQAFAVVPSGVVWNSL